MRCLALLVLASCVSEHDLTFDEFRAQTYREPDTGIYLVDGDIPIANDVELGRYYDALYNRDTIEQGLTVNTVNGNDDVWTSSKARNLTFCVDSGSFSDTRHDIVVAALEEAAAAWEGVAHVDFVHLSNQDATCSRSNLGVVFNVRPICTGAAFARAFFPSSSRSSRELLIDCTAFGNINPLTLAGVLRHELGHILGFRHEHVQDPNNPCAAESSDWRAVTSYDTASVMHYPHCGGSNSGDLVLTKRDVTGAQSLYPSPRLQLM